MLVPDLELAVRLLEICPSPVAASDQRGQIVVFNTAAEEVLGYPADEALGLHAAELYHHPEESRRVMARIRARPADLPASRDPIDVVLRARDGSPLPARVTAAFLRGPDGSPTGVVAFFEDLRENQRLYRRVEQASAQVAAAERRASTFSAASALSHAMSQPLTAAMGNVEMALMTGSGAATERLERCFEQLERIARIHQELASVLGGRSSDAGRS